MAAQDRSHDDRLDETLAGTARRYSFFQLVRLLERRARPAARVGEGGPATGECLRFRPDASLGFPATDVAALEQVAPTPAAPERARITTTFLGLYGSTSPLPSFYSEQVLWEDPDNARVRDFLDIFHHRLISFFYRAWSKYRYPVEFEHGKDDSISPRLFALVGLGSPAMVEATSLPASWRLLHFAGLFQHQPHSALDLERLLTDYFDGLPVEVEACTGRWIPIQDDQLPALGRSNCRLGVDCSIGRRVFGRMTSFRIWIGPCEHERLRDFLPGRDDHGALRRLVDLFVNEPLTFDVGLRMRGLPRLRLSSEEASHGAPGLGWDTWLFSDVPERDREATVVLDGATSGRSRRRP